MKCRYAFKMFYHKMNNKMSSILESKCIYVSPVAKKNMFISYLFLRWAPQSVSRINVS